jgi:chemotaxis protein methyltransferase CheR
MIPDLNDWNITIQATDINPEFLKKALKGVYAKWSFRNTPEWVRDRCFKKTKHGHYQIDPRIKKMVNFSFLNLMDTCYPSMASNTNAMDVIFCRNVLMYFVPEYVEQVISRMHKSHVEGGWLVVSPGEMSHLFYSLFKTVYLNGAIFYRKSSPQASSEKNYNMKPALPIQGMVHVCEKYFQPEIFFPERIDTSGKIMPQPQKAIPEPPDSMETVKAPLRGALKLFKDGHYTRAGVSLHELLSRDQDNGDAMALLARTYANQGDLARAADWCEKAIAADKLKPCFYHLFSTIMTEMGRFEAAVDALKKVIYLDYKFVLAYFSLGSINRQQGKLKESEKNFDNAISLLNRMQTEEIVPESEGMTAGRLKEIIKFTSGQEAVHE